jgi:hypothetical protein
MAELTSTEQAFLKEKKAIQDKLIAEIQSVEKDLAPIIEKYDSLQVEVDQKLAEMKKIAASKNKIVADSDVASLKKELSDVARDVTKLLKKQRS